MDDLYATFNTLVWGALLAILLVQVVRAIRLVPNQRAYVVERLGRYHVTLRAGIHPLIPFVDRVVAKLDLREETIDVPPQECFTKDEVKVEVDGVMYITVVEPVKATYGITDYRLAATQLAQTTTREVIGKLDLDQTFEERELISRKVVEVLDEVGGSWGIRVHRYEIKNIQPPTSVQDAMEKQVTAERDRRALVAKAEGEKQAMINRSEGSKQEMINRSEGEKQRRVNEAEGRAAEVLAIARATADSLAKIGSAVGRPGGAAALRLQLVEQYLGQIRALARPNAEVLLPLDLGSLEGLLRSLEPNGALTLEPGPNRTGAAPGGGGPSRPLPPPPAAPGRTPGVSARASSGLGEERTAPSVPAPGGAPARE